MNRTTLTTEAEYEKALKWLESIFDATPKERLKKLKFDRSKST